MKIGILHPGSMGSSVGLVLQEQGHDVFWASEERSEATRERAKSFIEKETIEELLDEVGVVFSICWQGGVIPNLHAATSANYEGIFVDANFVEGGDIGKHIQASNSKGIFQSELLAVSNMGSFSYVDAAIYGYPIPGPDNYTNERSFYLFGDDAGIIADLFEETPFDGVVLDEPAKMFRQQRMDNEADERT